MTAAPLQTHRGSIHRFVAAWRLLFRHPVATSIVVAIVLLVLAPLVSLVLIAMRGDAEIWPHLARYVLPFAIRETALLLLGVAAIAAVCGIGTAWLVTAYRFPGRD